MFFLSQVTFNRSISQQKLEMFFSNKKKSGGGEIESMEFISEEGKLLITFKDVEGKGICYNKKNIYL